MTKERRFHKLWKRLSFYHVYHSSTILPPAFLIPFGAKRLRHQTRGQGIWLTHPGIAIEFRMGRRSLEELSGNREGFPDEMEDLEELSGNREGFPDEMEDLEELSGNREGFPDEMEGLEELSGNREGFPDEMEDLEELSGKTGQIPDGTKVLRGLSAKPTGGSRHFLIRKVPGIIRCRGLV